MSQALANLSRRLVDVNLKKTIALPSGAATVNSASIDLGSARLGPVADKLAVAVEIPATPSLADTKTLTATVADSADDSTFTPIPGIGLAVLTGASSAGASAASYKLRIPSTTRRYIRLTVAGVASGGDNSALSATFAVLANE